MKPSIGREVWCIYDYELYKHEVGYVGKDSFIIDCWQDVNDDAKEYMYDEYQETWFTSFERAKQKLVLSATRAFNCRFKLKRNADDWYVLEERK